MQLQSQLRPGPLSARRQALHILLGEAGIVGVALVGVAAGIGVLIDFLVFNLHPIFSVGLLLTSVPISLYWTGIRTLSMDRRFNPNPDYVRNLALATVAGQSGCISVILVLAALFGGMFVDSRLDSHPVFTIVLTLVAVPVSLYAMIWLMLSSVRAIKHPPAAENSLKKENGS